MSAILGANRSVWGVARRMDAIEVETRDGLQRVSLDKPRLTIGRLPGNDIVLPFAQISRHHAELRQRGNDWWIIDLGSTNGLHVENRVVKEYLLRGGDSIVLAPAIVLHFISKRLHNDVTVEGTVQLPAVQPRPALARPVVVDDPFAATADEMAAAASMPLPRRRLGLTPPPTTQGAYAPGTPILPVAAPPLTDDDLDAWLNHGVDARSPERHDDRDIPQDSPYAIMRRQSEAQTAPNPIKKPILCICPTCGERTAPDSPYCWSCRHTIAQPCRVCQLYLLPIQSTCPRCATTNPHAIKR